METNYLIHHGVKGMKWGVRKQFQAAHRFRKSNKSNAIRVSKQYSDRIRGLEKRHEIEGEKIGDWGSTQGRKLMDRQYDEMKALKEEGRKAVNKAALLDAGYTEKQAEAGFKWMSDQEKKGSKYVMYKIKHSNEDDNFLVHHGVKGQKWGVRRYQNYDGSLIDSSRIKKIEKKAIKKEYKRGKKAGEHGYLFPFSRESTGSNYNKVRDDLEKTIKNDEQYKQLSKKAADVEKKRRAFEKDYFEREKPSFEDRDDHYQKLYSTKEYQNLTDRSEAAYNSKNNRVKEIEKQYVDKVKEAKLTDFNITKNRDKAKKYVNGLIRTYYWDGNDQYDNDWYYDPFTNKRV